jgi:hypothetical protein
MEKLINECRNKARKLFLLKEEEENSYAHDYFNFDVCFSCDGCEFGCYIRVVDSKINTTQIECWKVSATTNGYESALVILSNSISDDLERLKLRDGEVIELDGNKYRLTLIRGKV